MNHSDFPDRETMEKVRLVWHELIQEGQEVTARALAEKCNQH